MPSSILGKRTRSSPDSGTTDSFPAVAVTNPSSTALKGHLPRAKRQARADIFNDENESPFYSKVSSASDQDGDRMQLDPLSDLTPKKHGLAGKKITSPSVKPGGDFVILRPSNGTWISLAGDY